ncbi:CHAT domain-containing protein [Kribbella sp. NPDC051952]|uniref:CHAT domain-containing protein n=1 Tax=Kribbella sp. NPDC051952 TaxID=3154851 RepID=UPI003444C7DC
MDLRALEDALGGRPFTILSVTDESPTALAGLRTLGNVEIQLVNSNAEAAALVGVRDFNLVVVNEEDDWDEVKALIGRVRAGTTASIVVQGDRAGRIDRLRAVLAGADSYVEPGDDWSFQPLLEPGERPDEKFQRLLGRRLARFGGQVADEMMSQIQEHVATAADDASLSDVVKMAAAKVSIGRAKPIAAATMPVIRHLLSGAALRPNAVFNRPEAERGLYARRDAKILRPDELHWNIRFPEHTEIMRQKPHVVVSGREYPLQTALERAAWLDGWSASLSAEELQGKKIVYAFNATNGAFNLLGDGQDWHQFVMSAEFQCTEDGTAPLDLSYRAGDVGEARIEALLLVDGGSIARQTIDLEVRGTKERRQRRRTRGRGSLRVPIEAIAEPAGADVGLHLTPQSAGLWAGGELRNRFVWSEDLPRKVDPVARQAYRELRGLSEKFVAGTGLALLGQDGDDALVALAKIGSRLHQRVFTTWTDRPAPERMQQLADDLSRLGDRAHPPLMQLVTSGYSLPWGILYDRPLKKNAGVKDVDPEGFWGMRFDIYRDVVPAPAGVLPRRGRRWRLKPIVGDTVPRGLQQLAFIEEMAQALTDPDSVVQDASRSPKEIRAWAETDQPSDLLYLYCHAVPVDPATVDIAKPEMSSLVFGPTEQSRSRITLSQLRRWWTPVRPANPVVILNACASGQGDVLTGAPFVDFFTEQWGAQAFIGTDWPVQAAIADAIGRKLLSEVCDHRVSLRTALRSATNDAAAEGNYFPLMYAIYGPNNVQFCAPS